MRRYETFNPAIPEESVKPQNEALPIYEQVEENKEDEKKTLKNSTKGKRRDSSKNKREIKKIQSSTHNFSNARIGTAVAGRRP